MVLKCRSVIVFVTKTAKALFIKQSGVHIHRNATTHVIASLLLGLLATEVLSSHLDQNIAGFGTISVLAVRRLIYLSLSFPTRTRVIQELLLLDGVQPGLIDALEGRVVLGVSVRSRRYALLHVGGRRRQGLWLPLESLLLFFLHVEIGIGAGVR